MSEGDIQTILRDLRQQRRDVKNDIKDVLNRCESDMGLSKTEIERESERLKPSVITFVEGSDECLEMLNKQTEGDNNEMIED